MYRKRTFIGLTSGRYKLYLSLQIINGINGIYGATLWILLINNKTDLEREQRIEM